MEKSNTSELDLKKLEELKKEMEPYKDTLVLNYFEVVKLEDVIFDEGSNDPIFPNVPDYFWVYRQLNGKIYYSSCVGRWIPLKGKINDEEYENLERVWNLNYHK